jgi:hypothetical protein
MIAIGKTYGRTYLELACYAYEEILWLDITMYNVFGMKII